MITGPRAILLGLALAALGLGGCGKDDSKPQTIGQTTSPAPNTRTATVPTGAATAPAPNPEVLSSPDQRQAARTVSALVEAAELGDGSAFCRLVGLSPGQAEGIQALRSCSRRAHIDSFSLPSSDELSVKSVTLKGSRAVVLLDGGGRFVLAWQGRGFAVRSYAR